MLPFLNRTGVLLLLLVLVVGCSNRYAEQIDQNYQQTQQRLANLARLISDGDIANANRINRYALELLRQRPKLSDTINSLRRDATPSGAQYQGLLQRLGQVNRKPANESQYQQARNALEALWIAADPKVYNDALMDVVNTLASLSQGSLPPVHIPASSLDKANPGQYLVGNPDYGQWVDQNGQRVWRWDQSYSPLASLATQAVITYALWNRAPVYSYYRNYGRHYYQDAYRAPRQASTWQQLSGQNRPTKSYDLQSRTSTYATQSGNQKASYNPSSNQSTSDGQKNYGPPPSVGRLSTYQTMRQQNSRLDGKGFGPTNHSKAAALQRRQSSFFTPKNNSTTTPRPSNFSSGYGPSTRGISRSGGRFRGK